MMIQSIQLSQYRNYEQLSLALDPGINLFYGDNAQGKTNILEAIYLAGTNKSHRTNRDRDLISFGAQEAHIKMFVSKREHTDRIDVHLKTGKPKGIAINGIPITKTSQLLGVVNLVFFSPEDLQMIKNGPSERRRFIDMELCQLNRLYLAHLVRYNKALAQRNALLKMPGMGAGQRDDLLSVWEVQMEESGKQIIAFREQFTQKLDLLVGEIHGRLSGGQETLALCYEPQVPKEALGEALQKNRERDLNMKTTMSGPHRDDIRFQINGVDIRKFGSQGQQRTAALSLKLAEIDLVKLAANDTPVLLLDDVFSELDRSRQNQLFCRMEGVQTLMTCTGLDELVWRRLSLNRVFHVQGGTVTREAGMFGTKAGASGSVAGEGGR